MQGTDVNAARAEFSERLGVKTYPTVIFFKNNRILWTSSGSTSMEHDMKEGVLYYGDSMGGVKGSEYVNVVHTRSELDSVIAGSDPDELNILMITAPFCSPCIKVYPSVVTLAMNFKGVVSFARLGANDSPETNAMFESLRILEAPTFITFKDGVEVARIVTGNKGALIGHILEVVSKHGIAIPTR